MFTELITSKHKPLKQCAALPYQVRDGEMRVLIITSRATKRWIVPKGWLKPDVEPHVVAAEEAFEEAGLEGQIEPQPIGSYHYIKRLHALSFVRCKVDVYPMQVTDDRSDWPEKAQRTLAWLSPTEAANRLSDRDLAKIVVDFAKHRRCVEKPSV